MCDSTTMSVKKIPYKLGVAVFGVGIAGRARIRDIGSQDYENIRWQLKGYVSRRHVDIEGVNQLDEKEVLTKCDCHAVVVCTEPGAHEQVIRKALSNGKHVLVEYPVATSATVTRQLYSLAKEKDVILHEENIALLTPAFLAMKEKLRNAKSQVVKGEIILTGSYNGWLEDFERSGGPFCVNVSLIQNLYELFGTDITATGGQLEVTDTGFTAVGKLSSLKCKDLSVTIKRTKKHSLREKVMLFTLEDGFVIDDKPENGGQQSDKKPGLFMQDFLMFIGEVFGERDYGADSARVLHCISVAEQIHAYMGITH